MGKSKKRVWETGMIYNFNLGIGWASSGVEYAQSYRAAMLRNIGADAKFVFTDMFVSENIEHMTKNIEFLDSEVIWLYTFFTDQKIAPVSYTLNDLKETLPKGEYTYTRNGKTGRIIFKGTNNFYAVYFTAVKSDKVHRVEIFSGGFLIRKDYFTYGRVFAEYYAPLNNKAHMYLRRFFNEDGTVAYEEINDDGRVMYQFPDQLLCSKEELVGLIKRTRFSLTVPQESGRRSFGMRGRPGWGLSYTQITSVKEEPTRIISCGIIIMSMPLPWTDMWTFM